jgi:hypothetical protein
VALEVVAAGKCLVARAVGIGTVGRQPVGGNLMEVVHAPNNATLTPRHILEAITNSVGREMSGVPRWQRTFTTQRRIPLNKNAVRAASVAVLVTVLCLIATQGHTQELVREKLPNDMGIELLGKSIVYSFYYQRTINRTLALEAGLSALGGGSDDDSSTIIFLPIGARLYVIPKNGTFFISGGAVLLTATTDSGPFGDDTSSSSYGYLGPGMEFRSESGLLFRGTAYGLIADGGFFIWPGLTVGYSF